MSEMTPEERAKYKERCSGDQSKTFWASEVDKILDALDAMEESCPRCHICDKPATCLGSYEANTFSYACNDCCHHGCEDGVCYTFSEIPKRLDATEKELEKRKAAMSGISGVSQPSELLQRADTAEAKLDAIAKYDAEPDDAWGLNCPLCVKGRDINIDTIKRCTYHKLLINKDMTKTKKLDAAEARGDDWEQKYAEQFSYAKNLEARVTELEQYEAKAEEQESRLGEWAHDCVLLQQRIASLEASLKEESDTANALLAQRDEEESRAKKCAHAYRELESEMKDLGLHNLRQAAELAAEREKVERLSSEIANNCHIERELKSTNKHLREALEKIAAMPLDASYEHSYNLVVEMATKALEAKHD